MQESVLRPLCIETNKRKIKNNLDSTRYHTNILLYSYAIYCDHSENIYIYIKHIHKTFI